MISLKEAELTPDKNDFNKSYLPAAVLLEGIFPSAFKNRMTVILSVIRISRLKQKVKKPK